MEPHGPLTELGTDWGGWVVPAGVINESWTCYCVGAGSDVSFDLELIRRYGATVRCVDPLDEFRRQAESQAAGDPRFTFLEVAVATRDGVIQMWGAEDPESGSLSAVNLYETTRVLTKPGRTIRTLMAELGDERAELVKLDIEGSEYDVLETLDLRSLGIEVLCVEFHPTRSVHEALDLIERIRCQGYRPVHCKDRTNFTFVGEQLAERQLQ
jgi:FkbM family methyltransferase